jgi:CBS domain containing-hemolysin-like protein
MRLFAFLFWLGAILFWAWLLVAVILYMGFQWHAVVEDCCRESLLFWILILTAIVAVCSLTETALSTSRAEQVSAWVRSANPRWVGLTAAELAVYALRNRPAANALIVLTNTAATIAITVVTAKELIDPAGWQLAAVGIRMPFSGSYGFTMVGLTIVLFVMGETIPKQIALKYHVGTLIRTGWLIAAITWFPLTRLVAVLIIRPIQLIFGIQED